MQVCDFCKFISLNLLVIICIAVLNFVLLKVLWYTRFGLKTAHWQDLRSSSVLLLHVVWMFDVPLVRFKLLRHYSPLLPPMTWLQMMPRFQGLLSDTVHIWASIVISMEYFTCDTYCWLLVNFSVPPCVALVNLWSYSNLALSLRRETFTSLIKVAP